MMNSDDIRNKTPDRPRTKAALPAPRTPAPIPRLVGADETEAPEPPPAPRVRPPKPARRDTRRRCERCGEECPFRNERGGVCALEQDRLPELDRADGLPALLGDVLRAEMRTFFRAKRREADGGGIDNDASKLAQAIVKEAESLVEIERKLAARPSEEVERDPIGTEALLRYPSLAAAMRASGDALFSEVADAEERERLRRRYLAALRIEDEVLGEVTAL